MNKQPYTNYLKSPVTPRHVLFPGARSLLALATMFIAAEALAAGQIDYVVTAPVNPVKPGELVEFDVTVHNLTGSDQTVNLTATVPPFTRNGGFGPGDHFGVIFGTVLAGTSQTRIVRLTVDNGDQAPPDGQQITLTMEDSARGVVGIQRTVTVQSMQPLNLRLSTAQASVATGQNFTYTVSVSNVSAGTLSGVNLNVTIPQGASFVSADGATHSGADVNWALNTLPPGVNRQLHVTLKCNATENDPLGPVVATVTDAINHTAQASDTRAVDSSPDFEYTITSPIDPPRPGDTAVFNVTVHNRSNSDRSLTLTGTVPLFTDNGGFVPGNGFGIVFGTVSAGTSQTRIASLTVRNGTVAPPNGATITLNLIDLVRAASISRSVVVGSVSTAKADFNGDGLPDWVLYNPLTHQLAVWYLNDGTFLGGAVLPTLPAGWTVIDADQFGGSGTSSDLLLFNSSTGATAVWYFNGASLVTGALGPTVPAGWTVLLSEDFNSDGKPDLLLYQASTHKTAVWFLNGTAFAGGGFGPTLPAGWAVAGAADFNSDGKPDLLLWTPAGRNTAIWYLNGTAFLSGAGAPTLPAGGWRPAAIDDVNRDGKPDFVLWNPNTRQTAVWHLNNNVLTSGVFGPSTPANWWLVAPK